MARFGDLGIESGAIIGKGIEIEELFGKRILIEKTKIAKSKFTGKNNSGMRLQMQVVLASFNECADSNGDFFVKKPDGTPDGERRCCFTGSDILIEGIQEAEQKFQQSMRNAPRKAKPRLNFTRSTQPLSKWESVLISPKMATNMQSFLYEVCKYVVGAIGGIVALLAPTVPFIVICTIAVLMDCYTAWALSKRVKKKFPGANDGKFKSHYAGRVFLTLIKVYAVIVLAFLIDNHIFPDFPLLLPNIIAGAICFWQMWSMLENESSCNDAKWAIVAQRIMVDKTERHFDLDLHDLKEHEIGKCGNRVCAYNGTIACKAANVKHCPNYQPINDDENGKS